MHPRLGAGESIRAMQMRVIQGFEAAIDIAEGRNHLRHPCRAHRGDDRVLALRVRRCAAASRHRLAAAKWCCFGEADGYQ